MSEGSIRVLVFVNESNEMSIPLEIVASITAPDIDIRVCSFFPPETHSFDVDLLSLDASSQVDFGAYCRFVRTVRDFRPDLLHVHPNATGSVVRLLATLCGVPNVVTTEHSDHANYRRLTRVVNGLTNSLNDVVISNSKATERSFKNWEQSLLAVSGVERRIVYNGTDVDGIKSYVENDICFPDGFLIGSVGRLVKTKNHRVLIDAIALLSDGSEAEDDGEFNDVYLVFVGDGPERGALEKRARQRGVNDRVIFTSQVPRDTVYGILHHLDVFAFPSQYEGFGVALIEAMAAETPIVANDVPVLREVVGSVGLYADSADPSTFADNIRHLYRSEHLRDYLAHAAKERVQAEFSIAATVGNHIELYRNVVTKNRQ